MQPLSLDKFGDPLHAFDAFTASVCNLRPTSRGSVHVTTRDPLRAAADRAQLPGDREDLRVAVDSLRLTRRIVAAPALAPLSAGGTPAGAADRERRRHWRTRPATSAPRSSIRSARAGWDGRRSRQRGRRAAARARHRRVARRRCLGDAHDHVRQHQRADDDDRREGERHDSRGPRRAPRRAGGTRDAGTAAGAGGTTPRLRARRV